MNNAPKVVETGFLHLISQASPMAQLVLLMLLMASILCWAIIFTKWRSLKTASSENSGFLKIFWQSKSIEEIFHKSDKYGRSPVASVFKSGFKELEKFTNAKSSLREEAVDNITRALARQSNAEIASLEKHLSWLATTASAAPFVGLFGTVWGIMNSFQNIGASGAANLAVVAPGIAEALIATAAGIGAAIPAVIAYNHFAGQVKRQAIDIDGFSQDFLNIVQRSVLGAKKEV
jgi:biopolymer transport protein TolQ